MFCACLQVVMLIAKREQFSIFGCWHSLIDEVSPFGRTSAKVCGGGGVVVCGVDVDVDCGVDVSSGDGVLGDSLCGGEDGGGTDPTLPF